MVEPEPIRILISQALVGQHLVEYTNNYRMIQQHLRRSTPVVALLGGQCLGIVLESELVLANWAQLFLCQQTWQQKPGPNACY